MTDHALLRILVVEDSALTAEQLCGLIRSVRFPLVISVVATQQEAIAAIEQSTPDLVILDLKLREGSGFGVLRELALRQAKPAVAVLTNYALPKYQELSALMGYDYFLDKARDFNRLPTIIKSINDLKRTATLTQIDDAAETNQETI